MKIAIYPDNGFYPENWAKFLKQRDIDVKWADLTAINALEQVKGCDGVMWSWSHAPHDKIKAPRILHTIEHYLKIPVFPDRYTCWHYDDKIAQYYLLQAAGIPMPETWVFWDKSSALDWAKKTEYPKIFKLSAGSGSSNVIKVLSEKGAKKLINKMFGGGIFPMIMNEHKPKNILQNLHLWALLSRIKHVISYGLIDLYPPLPISWWQPEKGYIYFQEFLPDNAYDTRIAVIGNRAFGFHRFNRENDFRASGSGNCDADHAKIDIRCVEIAFKISKILKFQSMAYDFLLKNNKPVVVEFQYTTGKVPGEKCDGHWDSNLNWIPGKISPEEAQIEDFIAYIMELKKNEN